MIDWTRDDGGRQNNSPLFLKLCDEIELLIRNDANALLNGRADVTARLIMAQLAHRYGLGPERPEPWFPPGSRTRTISAEEWNFWSNQGDCE